MANTDAGETVRPRAAVLPPLPVPPLPVFPLRPVFAHAIQHIARRHPRAFERLGAFGARTYLIDPLDLPFVLVLAPDPSGPRLTPHHRGLAPATDAAISGAVFDLVRLISGRADGDALFFSRALRVTGDTGAVVALRNAIDDMEIDLADEVAAAFGPFAPPAKFVLERALELAETLARLRAGSKER